MGKRNLSALMDGLLSSTQTDRLPSSKQLLTSDGTTSSGPSTKTTRRGRPRIKTADCEEVRTTLLLDRKTLAKLRLVAISEGKSMKSIIDR